jgi:hypothetical protein
MPESQTTTYDDIQTVREALTIAAHAKPNPVWECEYAIPAFNRIASRLRSLENVVNHGKV